MPWSSKAWGGPISWSVAPSPDRRASIAVAWPSAGPRSVAEPDRLPLRPDRDGGRSVPSEPGGGGLPDVGGASAPPAQDRLPRTVRLIPWLVCLRCRLLDRWKAMASSTLRSSHPLSSHPPSSTLANPSSRLPPTLLQSVAIVTERRLSPSNVILRPASAPRAAIHRWWRVDSWFGHERGLSSAEIEGPIPLAWPIRSPAWPTRPCRPAKA